MDKETFEALSRRYSPLIKWIIESNQIYTNIDRPIRWGLRWKADVAIAAETNRKTNLLSVNLAFVKESYENGRIYEIEYFLLHEMRHVFQHVQIEYSENGKAMVDEGLIKQWKMKGENYIKALDENGNEVPDYFKQDCELDAYAFSFAVMHLKYGGEYDPFLYVPKIYQHELEKAFSFAVQIFLHGPSEYSYAFDCF